MTEWLNANQGLVMAALTLAYVVTTIIMMKAMLRSNALSREALSLARTTDKNRTRPYVFFDIELRHGWVYAVLRNTGITPALNVRLQLTPELTHDAGSVRKETGLSKHSHGFLAPGRVLEDFIDFGPSFFLAYPHTRQFVGTLEYGDPEGSSYSEPVLVDLKVH